jgi:hypothetical protein
MEPAAPTPEELVARLKEVTGAKTDPELATILHVPLRTLSNWKKGNGMEYETAVRLLDLAGWLCVDEAAERARTRRAELYIDRAEEALKILAP